MFAGSKRIHRFSTVKNIFQTNRAIILFFINRFANMIILSWFAQTLSTLIAVKSILFSNSAYSAFIAMIDIFWNIVVKEVANRTEVFAKLLVTFFALIWYRLNFFTIWAHNTFHTVSIHPLHLASFFKCYTFVMTESTWEYFLTTWRYNTTVSIVMRTTFFYFHIIN